MKAAAGAPRFLTLPGRHGVTTGHWLARWEAQHGMHRVEQSDWTWPRRGDWMARLDEAMLDDARGPRGPVVLVAHDLGCHLVAAWAAHSRLTARVRAALLVAPPDIEASDAPHWASWRPPALRALPFDSTVVAGTDDPCCSVERARWLARRWHADFVVAGATGGFDAPSLPGAPGDGCGLLDELLRRAAATTVPDGGGPSFEFPPTPARAAAPTTTP